MGPKIERITCRQPPDTGGGAFGAVNWHSCAPVSLLRSFDYMHFTGDPQHIREDVFHQLTS